MNIIAGTCTARNSAVRTSAPGRSRWSNINATATHDVARWKARFIRAMGPRRVSWGIAAPFSDITLYSDRPPCCPTSSRAARRWCAEPRRRASPRRSSPERQPPVPDHGGTGSFVSTIFVRPVPAGDLAVTVFEADGGVGSFLVPSSAVPHVREPSVEPFGSARRPGPRRCAARRRSRLCRRRPCGRGIDDFWLTVYSSTRSSLAGMLAIVGLSGAAVDAPMSARLRWTSHPLRAPRVRVPFPVRWEHSPVVKKGDPGLASPPSRWRPTAVSATTRSCACPSARRRAGHDGVHARQRPEYSQPGGCASSASTSPSTAALQWAGPAACLFNGCTQMPAGIESVANATTYQVGYSNLVSTCELQCPRPTAPRAHSPM